MVVVTPAAIAAASTASVSFAPRPTGFSIQKALPAFAAAIPISACKKFGAQIETTSTSGWANTSL